MLVKSSSKPFLASLASRVNTPHHQHDFAVNAWEGLKGQSASKSMHKNVEKIPENDKCETHLDIKKSRTVLHFKILSQGLDYCKWQALTEIHDWLLGALWCMMGITTNLFFSV